jgi:hypothetical protein
MKNHNYKTDGGNTDVRPSKSNVIILVKTFLINWSPQVAMAVASVSRPQEPACLHTPSLHNIASTRRLGYKRSKLSPLPPLPHFPLSAHKYN